MALSERDELIMTQLETSFLQHGAARPVHQLRPPYLYGAVVGLLVCGAALTAAGLRMSDALGTGLGVVGCMLIWSGCCDVACNVKLPRSWGRFARGQWRAAVQDAGIARPPHHLEDGPR